MAVNSGILADTGGTVSNCMISIFIICCIEMTSMVTDVLCVSSLWLPCLPTHAAVRLATEQCTDADCTVSWMVCIKIVLRLVQYFVNGHLGN